MIENCNYVSAVAQNVGKVVSFWPNFDPNFFPYLESVKKVNYIY